MEHGAWRIGVLASFRGRGTRILALVVCTACTHVQNLHCVDITSVNLHSSDIVYIIAAIDWPTNLQTFAKLA